MPYCGSCGSFVENENKFCGECGAPNEKYTAQNEGVNEGLNNKNYVSPPQNNFNQTYQTNQQYQNQNTYYYQPDKNEIDLQKKKSLALTFSIIAFVFAILSVLIEPSMGLLGIIFFIPAMVNWAKYKGRSGRNDAKLALIFTIIAGAVSTFMMLFV